MVQKGIASVSRRYSLVIILIFSAYIGALAQTAGDYRSAGSGDFDQAGTWETYNGSSWVAALAPPDENDGTVTIQFGHTVIVDADHTISSLEVEGELYFETLVEFAVTGNIEVASGGEIDVQAFGMPVISVQGNLVNDGSIDFQMAYVVVAGNFTSTGTTEMKAANNLGSIVVGGDVSGNFDFNNNAETHLIAVNPNATVDINPTDSYSTDISDLPFWVQLFIIFIFPEVNETINETIYGSPNPCAYTIEGPVNTVSCSGSTVYFEISSTTASSPSYQWEVNDGSGWSDVSNGPLYAGAGTATLTISSAGISMDGYIFRCELGDPTLDPFPCVKKSFSATLTVLPDAAPSAPSTTGVTDCLNTSVTLMASGAGADEDYFWYDAPAGGSWLQFTGSSYTTPVLASTTTYYASVYNTISGCESERTSVTATLVPPNTAGAPSSTPTLCINTVLTAITHATTNATGIGVATGLPAGVTANWAGDVITISGTPTASGPFNYSIPLTGGCGNVSATGTINVTPDMTAGPASSSPTPCINTVMTNITHATTLATGIGVATGLPAGVTASWAGDVITISGTPTASGPFNYSIPLTGGCGNVSATGTINVTPDMTAGPASSSPTPCINTVMTNITHATTLATGIGVATGLPAGVTASWAGDVITISGTPTASGPFNYSIPLTGGCGNVSATGTINVTPDMTAGPASSSPTPCINTVMTNITHATTLATGIGVATGLPAGVTASWAGDVITISGTPTASGPFNYSIPLTGGCGNVSATGTINVTPDMTAGPASSSPTPCINTVMTNITHATTLATGIGVATGLPAGVTASWAGDVITISGTPTASGPFNYSIPLTGGCGNVSATGTINVTPDMTAGPASSSPTPCINTVMTNITHATTLATGIGVATGLPAGVTASWAGDVITISGTPTASGPFNYSIPLTGGCGNVSATGTINVTPDMTAGPASSSPTPCINTVMTNITHATTLATGIGVATGLPAGVTASWAGDVITISGTPTASGPFNYSIPLTGGCGNVSATGTINVTPDMTAGPASSSPTPCINTVMTNITHATTLATGIGVATGLPAGVTASWDGDVITISGTPTASGPFNYSIPLTGGCGNVSATGTINVTPDMTAGPASSSPTPCINTVMTNITHATTLATGIGVATGLPAGVTASWAGDVITISGTPTASGPFNYSIPLTGGCGNVSATGTINVTPDMTAGPASSSPTPCINTVMTNITHATTLATGIGVATGLPAGVTASWAGDVITISGTPTASGPFNYSIPLTGGCGNVSATGTINVTPDMTAGPASSSPTPCINTVMTNITHATTLATGIGVATGLPAGVTASWAGDVITISGTPTASGPFNYSIPLTGGCGNVSATGTINVTPDMTAGPASSSPTPCINTVMTNITHATTLATGIGVATGLPAGVTASWAGDVITISGTPTASGPFNYSIPLTGGCGNVSATGTINVTPDMTAGPASSSPTPCINTVMTNITHATTLATGIGVATGLPAGVTASWAGDVITISGTPTASGPFNYSIPLTGGCGNVSATGTINVTPDMTAGPASSSPTPCINTVMTNITHATTLATGIGVATGLPAGVTASWAGDVITISGTPTASGPFNYSIPLTGGCGNVSATGTINVTPDMTAGPASSSPTPCINTVMTNITHATTLATGIGVATGLPAGVTASWAGDVITISGTPTASGPFNYSIPLTGGCGNVSATGTINVTPDMTAGPASSSPTPCINTVMTNITHATTLATGIGVATGLPAGVTASWAGDVITISGTPTASGPFNYSIPLTGGCGNVSATGTINVTPDMTAGPASSSPTPCINTVMTNITHATTLATGIGVATGLPAGVTASWAGDVITISGTPTASGPFNYSIPLTGGCGNVSATGTINVTPDMTAGPASSSPTPCINTVMTNITHATTLATGIGVATGLPAGVTASWAGDVITISGTPTASGPFNYSIPLTGGCGNVSATGTINVTPDMTAGPASSSPTPCINTVMTNITHATTLATGIGVATGLPAGVTASWAGDVITISGTPTASGTFNYSIPLTGGCGNVSATGTIVIEDLLPPIISCPADRNEEVDLSGNFMIPDYRGLVIVSDNCDPAPTLSQDPLSGTVIGVAGTVETITITALDGSGNSSQCTFDITLIDPVVLSISCPGDRNEYLDTDCEFALPDYRSLATVTGETSVTQLPVIGTIISGNGTQTISLTAHDGVGNTESCTFNVSLLDSIDPVAICQDITVSLDASGNASIDSSDVDGGSSDNCSIATMTLDTNNFTCADLGVNTVSMTVGDGSGNVSLCTAIVTVIDEIDPQVICPGDTTVTASPGDCRVAVDDISVVSQVDNCNVNQVGFRLEGATSGTGLNDASGTVFNNGTTTVWYRIIDAGGNEDSCSFEVLVLTTLIPPDSAYSDRESICPGDGTITLSYSGGDPVSSVTAVWYSDASFTTIVGSGNNLMIEAPLASITYYVRFESECDTTSAASVTVSVNEVPVPVFVEPTEEPCVNGPLYRYVAGGQAGSQFAWNISNGTIVTNKNDTIFVDWGLDVTTGILELTETSVIGCVSDPVTLTVHIGGPSLDLGGDAIYCAGESVTISPEGEFTSFLWHDGSTGPQYTADQEGWIGLEVMDSNGCTAQDSLYVSEVDLPFVDLGPDTIVCSDAGIILDAGDEGDQYLWSTGETSQQIIVFNEGTREIWVEVHNSFGCAGSDTIQVNACDLSHIIDLPTGITPNDDGVNDVWNIGALSGFEDAVVDIYDQWGTLIWRSAPGYPVPWDGRNMNEKPVPVDSYHFVIHFNDGSEDRYVGYITVIR